MAHDLKKEKLMQTAAGGLEVRAMEMNR